MKHLLFISLILISCNLYAQNFDSDAYHYRISRTDEEIIVDGIINENVWSELEPASHFWQHYPVDTAKAAIPTIVKMTYNDEYLFLSAWCMEEGANPTIQNLVRDDNGNYWISDAFAMAIDPLNTNMTGYFFGMNAGGGMQEGTISQQSLSPNLDIFWNSSWKGQVTYDNKGYYYEMAIPFNAINFDPENTTWGINFIRNDMKRNAYDLWTKYATVYSGIDFAFNGHVTFTDGLPETKGKRLEITPSVSGNLTRNIDEGESLKTSFNGGLNAKYAVTENMSLDMAILPDFSTVEVDKQYIDFYRYEYKVPEQRSLFLENNDLFALPGSDEDWTIVAHDAYRVKPLYTRRIGIKNWQNTPITYGAKLSGNVVDDLRVGVFNVQVQSHEEDPAQNYSAVGFQQTVLKNSSISGLFLNRQPVGEMPGEDVGKSSLEKFNRNAGLEFDYISNNNKLSASFLYHKNISPEHTRKSSFYGTELDYRTRVFRTRNSIYHVDENFIADMGYVPRLFHYDDVNDTTYRIAYKEFSSNNMLSYYPGRQIRMFRLSSQTSAYVHPGAELNEVKLRVSTLFEFDNRSMFGSGIDYSNFEMLYANDVLKNDNPLPAGNYTDLSGFAHFITNPRKSLGFDTRVDYGKFYNGRKLSADAKLIYKIQPWFIFTLNYNLCDIDLPEFKQHEIYHLLGGRAELNFTRDISWTTLMQYNTQIDNININSLFKWRYRPLSDFQVVVKNDSDLYFNQKHWQLVFKLNYWLQI